MSSDGVKMLVKHLQDYKQSTLLEIESLQSKNRALEAQHEVIMDELEERKEAITEHERLVNNLQSLNSRKYRAEERDDWQTLVESLNEDRDFLHKDLEDIDKSTTKCIHEVWYRSSSSQTAIIAYFKDV